MLIEDSAQSFPSGKEKDIWQVDLVVLSFGRGKPVSLLGGGAVLCRDRILDELLPEESMPFNEGVQKKIVAMLGELELDRCGITDLPKVCNTLEDRRLLRYPLLVKPEARDILYTSLLQAGLGPSRMCPAVLSKISGLESMLSLQGECPAAESFAERLLTLPTHQQVS